MKTDKQFEAKHTAEYSKDHWTYYGFGFTALPHNHTKDAIGAIEHTRLGATRYYLQTGTLTNQRWQEVAENEWHRHCRAI